MEFGQIILSQITSIFSLSTVIFCMDNLYMKYFCNAIVNCSLLNVADNQGIFLFVFVIYLISMTVMLEAVRMSSTKNLSLHDKIIYIKTCNYNNSFLLFVNFLSIYIYKKLYTRTLNLLLFSLVNSALYIIVYLMDLKALSGYFYFNFVLGNLINFFITYINEFDRTMNFIMRYYGGFRMVKGFFMK